MSLRVGSAYRRIIRELAVMAVQKIDTEAAVAFSRIIENESGFYTGEGL